MIFLVYSIDSVFNWLVLLFPCPTYCTSMARYSLFVLKVPLNNNKTNGFQLDQTLYDGLLEEDTGCRRRT